MITRAVAICYIRKSLVKTGAPEPASPALQHNQTAQTAASLGLTPEFFEDAEGHRSGKTQDRPGWQAALARRADPDVAAVIVHTWDRAARNTKHLLQIADDCEAAGVRFISVSDSIDTRTAAGRFQLTIIAGVGEYESNASSERRIATIDYLRRTKGRHYGSTPFGAERVKQDGDLVLVPSTRTQPNGTDHAALLRAYELYGEGRRSLRRAVMCLNAEGWRWRRRNGELALWTSEALRRTLANHWVYAGYVVIGSAYRKSRGAHEILKGSHAPLVPDNLIAPIAAVFAAYKGGQTRRVPFVYPLTGLLYCGICGTRLAGSMARNSRFYRHPLLKTDHFATRSANRLEEAVREHISAVLARRPKAEQAQTESDRLAMLAHPGLSDTTEQRRLAAALDRLQDLYTWGEIDGATYRKRQAAIRASIPAATATATAPLILPEALTATPEYIAAAPPLELMAIARAMYSRIDFDGQQLTYIPRDWCSAWAA